MYNPFSHLVYAVSGADVITTIINGNVVMENRKLCHLDVEAVMKEVEGIAKHIRNSRLK